MPYGQNYSQSKSCKSCQKSPALLQAARRDAVAQLAFISVTSGIGYGIFISLMDKKGNTMKKPCGRLAFLPAAVVLFSAATVSAQGKKFIELGWDIPNTAYLREHHAEMQRTAPFDGVMLDLEAAAPDGKRYSSQSVMDAQPWEAAWFATAVADLKACRWTTFTDNFIRFNFTPGSVDWDDDNGWTVFCGKSALCAQIAKETGLKGLAIDFELYGKAIFTYPPDSARSFEETNLLVRKRGRQWMEAVAPKYPDMVLFTLFVGYVNLPAASDYRPEDTLKTSHYGLLPAFFNGMLDAVPPKMRIVDGNEMGYYLNGFDAFCRLSLAIQSIGGPAIRLVAPENREKYVSQVQVGFGFYLDMYTNPEGDAFYRGPKEGGTRLDRLAENLAAARDTADEYVWLYGEKQRWWGTPNPRVQQQHWDEAMPGMSRTIRLVNNPRKAATQTLEMLRKENQAINLLKNPDFTESNAGWGFWQDKPLGKLAWDNGAAKMSSVANGCILQGVRPVKSGEYYYVSIDGKQQGAGKISMRIRWNDADGKWTREVDDRIVAFENAPERLDGRPLAEGWSRAESVVQIPEGVAEIKVLLGVRDQAAESDAAWFDNAVLIRLQ